MPFADTTARSLDLLAHATDTSRPVSSATGRVTGQLLVVEGGGIMH